ncbi:hypothetical protein EAG18_08370 [Pseudoalteromonas sp. J010]|uniref:hypothetical protein n=1 Tax=Pseudoalteromonas sp. J010 TaxID=998465 RepID=UPI000F648D6C|nr:hypothetical protein [Pseudoalteromonas sp. J010]RRS09125.1 hypothetical protein EAG18_08370 [Pseudoalteromonas sp. J010]
MNTQYSVVTISVTDLNTSIKRLSKALIRQRWKSAYKVADMIRDRLFNDEALREITQLERNISPDKFEVTLNIQGPKSKIAEVVAYAKVTADHAGLVIDTDLDLTRVTLLS